MEDSPTVDGFIQVDDEISIRDVSLQEEYCDELLPLHTWEGRSSPLTLKNSLSADYKLFSEKRPIESNKQDHGFEALPQGNQLPHDDKEKWLNRHVRQGALEIAEQNSPTALSLASSVSSLNSKEHTIVCDQQIKCDDITNKTLLKSFKKYNKSPKKGSVIGSASSTTVKTSSTTSSICVPVNHDQDSDVSKPESVPSHPKGISSQATLTASMCTTSASLPTLKNTSKINELCSSPQKEMQEGISDAGGVPSPSEGETAPQSTGNELFLTGVISKIQKKIVHGENLMPWTPTTGDQDSDKMTLSALKDGVQKLSTPLKNIKSETSLADIQSNSGHSSNSYTVNTARDKVSAEDGNSEAKESCYKALCKAGRRKRGRGRRGELSILYDALKEIKWVQKMSLKKLITSKQLRHSTTGTMKPKVVVRGKKTTFLTPKLSQARKRQKSNSVEGEQRESRNVQSEHCSKPNAVKKSAGSKPGVGFKDNNKLVKKGAKEKGSQQKAAVNPVISVKNIKVEPTDENSAQIHVVPETQESVTTTSATKLCVIPKVQIGPPQQEVPPIPSTFTSAPQLTQLREQNHLTTVLREIHSTLSSSDDESQKNSKKRKVEDDSLRSSIRQSECAFRYKEIVVKKYQNYIHIVLLPNESKLNTLTLQTLRELKEAITSVRKDASCRVLLLSSSGKYFCSGVDLSILIGPDKQQTAHQLASEIKSFIETLSTFPKPVVAAVNGVTIGLGVILLTYCDVVFASDKATFCTPYCRYGYVPEGAGTITLPQVVGATIASDMLLRGRKLTALEAHTYGLVSEVFWPTKVMEEVIPRVQAMAEQSARAMEVTKALLRCHLWERVKVTLDNEVHILPKQWLSQSCQDAIKVELEVSRKSS